MFLTALAPNLFAAELAGKIAGVEIGWATWMFGELPLGILLFLATPVITYVVYPPAIKRGPEVVAWAAAELVSMGPISRREVGMAALAIAALVGWIFGGTLVAPAIVSLIAIAVMVMTGVVTWSDVLGNKPGWNVLVWFSTLFTMADGLNQVGVPGWIAERTAASLAGWSALTIAVLLIALYFVLHYLFASTTAHATAVLPAFLAAIVAVPELPVRAVVLTILYSVGLMGVLTPYATGPAPVWFNAGYIAPRDFWKLGAIMGAVYLLALLAIELPYLLYIYR
jgi:L-tartrate/succinate antiporter